MSFMDRFRNVRKANRSQQILDQYSANLTLQTLVETLQEQIKRERALTDEYRLKAHKYEELYLSSLRSAEQSFESVGGRSSVSTLRERLERKYQDLAQQKVQPLKETENGQLQS